MIGWRVDKQEDEWELESWADRQTDRQVTGYMEGRVSLANRIGQAGKG